MTCCKIYLVISALITCQVSANYEYERLKTLSHLADISKTPWNSQYDIYEGASSVLLPHYSDRYESSEDRSRNYFGSPSEHFLISSTKGKPIEKKNLKKTLIPFSTNKNSIKHKELFPDSGTAHCQEIKIKSTGKDGVPQKNITCYKCKDPKTRTTYERCLYNSHPEESASANTKVEHFLSAPTGFRHRRSSLRQDKNDYGRLRNPYRFTDEYFTDASHDVPAAYESKREKCNKVVKNDMVCMVCKDTKTNGKYEQCSYVKQPHEKAYSYKKSNSFGKPQQQKDDNDERPESTSYFESSDFDASNQQKDRNPTAVEKSHEYSYPSENYSKRSSTKNEQDEVPAPSQADCKQVEKDSKTCTVCKDSKTGGTYEKCTYNYQPSDKLYKYSKSKTFGYPDKTSASTQENKAVHTSEKSKDFDYPQSSDSIRDYLDKSEHSTYPRRSDKNSESQAASDSGSTSHSPNYSSDYYNPEGSSNYELPSSNDDDSKSYGGQADSSENPSSKSTSEHYSENISKDNCKEIQKDSMTCTVCKDPNSGNDFERCSYSYQPSDKLFSYSKSSSFGNPRENDRSQETPHETEQSSDSSETAKDSYDEYIPRQVNEASTTDEEKSEDAPKEKKEDVVDLKYLDTAKKKAEIEEFMQNFRKEDRSKCKKIMRDRMTCYQCIDKEGFQKEECAFVTGQEPSKDQLAFHEVKEFQIDPSSLVLKSLKSPNSTKTKPEDPLEPSASASGNSYVRLEKPDNEYPDETRQAAEETKEAEPYDYTSETRAVYDKVLGLTLPAYMFTTSEHEAAFDEVVASSQDQR